jgi:hypothetical protein
MKEINNPLTANIDRSNGNIEISIAKKYSETEEAMYKSFMSVCAMQDKALVDTSAMDDKDTMKACGMQYDKMRAMLNETPKVLGGLTEKQKKLPPALQKAILKKMKEDGKLTEKEMKEESEAVTQDLLSKKDQKKVEVAVQDDMKKVDNPKEQKVSKAAHELPADVKKTLTEIAEELDSGVKAHASQAKRIRDMLK